MDEAPQVELFEEIRAEAVTRGYMTKLERHMLTVEISPDAAAQVDAEAHREKVIRRGGWVAK